MPLISRRDAIAFGALILAGPRNVIAAPDEAEAEAAKFTAGQQPQRGRITIDLPEIAENGNTVPLAVTVDAPMEEGNYVSDVLVVSEGNPRPGVATFHFTPA